IREVPTKVAPWRHGAGVLKRQNQECAVGRDTPPRGAAGWTGGAVVRRRCSCRKVSTRAVEPEGVPVTQVTRTFSGGSRRGTSLQRGGHFPGKVTLLQFPWGN